MRSVGAIAIAFVAVSGYCAADPLLTPGEYRTEVRIHLPNVQDVAAPLVIDRCLSAEDLASGRAFFVLSDNPLKYCALRDYQVTGNAASYRIVCPGPNMGSALGKFETVGSTYRGSIFMNMGGKNMTMSETQIGRRIGECP